MLTVGTAVNYAATAGVANAALLPSQLDKGSIGIYGVQKGSLVETLIISGSTTTGKTGDNDFIGDTFKICEGLGGGKFKKSEFFNRKGFDLLNASAYRAPAPWRGYIGWNTVAGTILITGLKEAYNSVDLEFREIYSNREEGQRIYVSVAINPTGETAETIADKVVAAVNANTQAAAIVTAVKTNQSTTNFGVRFEAVDATKSYTLQNRGNIETSPMTFRGVDLGAGTYAQLRRFELESQAKKGNFYTLDREYKEVPASLVEGTTYDVYMLGTVNSHVPGGYGGAGLAGNPYVGTSIGHQVVFAQPQDSTAGKNQIEFETIIQVITGLTFTSVVEAP